MTVTLDHRPATADVELDPVSDDLLPRWRRPGSASRLPRRAPAIALAVALVASAGVGARAVHFSLHSARHAPQAQWATAWDQRVEPIAEFVEHERGLSFTHPVATEFLADAKFRTMVTRDEKTSPADTREMENGVAELRALGLIHGNVDLLAKGDQLAGDDVVGLYVPHDRTIYVRGSELTPFVRATLAHELTHALQDQHFDLEAIQSHAANDNESEALTSLIEGDAVRVGQAYEASMSDSDRAAVAKATEDQSVEHDDIPAILTNLFTFPYVYGPSFVQILVSKDGNATVDRAFESPPRSDAEVIDPLRYINVMTPVAVAAPALPAGAKRLEQPSTFGMYPMFEVLGAPLGFGPAWNALTGWRGDQSLAYKHQGKACVAIATALATDTDATRFLDTVNRWRAAVSPAAQTERAGLVVTLRSCDPGSSAPRPPVASPAASDVLALRTQLLASLVDAGAPVDKAACVTDGVMRVVPSAELTTMDDATPAAQKRIRNATMNASRTCAANH
jgi:hypothetical protein